MFLYTYDGSEWSERIVLADVGRHVSIQLDVSKAPARDVVSWISRDTLIAYHGRITDGELTALRVPAQVLGAGPATGRLVSRSARLFRDVPVWVTQYSESKALRVLTATTDSLALAGAVDVPYLFPILQAVAQPAPDELLVAVGDGLSRPPQHFFSSLLLHLRVRCG